MCDTIVATPEVTRDGNTLFGKNSDREPNEAQHLLFVPAAGHPAGSQVQCTYISIPQAEHTYAVLLSKPFWMWGAEIGVNEHGVAIGNESIFAKIPAQKKEALIGMDLLRLGLERAATAAQAVQVITDLLSEYGQGGNCGLTHKFFYHNSFLIADPHTAWVLETVDRHWAARKVKGIYTISNGLTIGSEWDLASPGLVSFAVQKGWCKGRHDFDFARCYSDSLYTTLSDSRRRRSCTAQLLNGLQGKITPASLMAALRDHGSPEPDTWRPDRGVVGMSVCAHAGFGPVRSSQTTGSMVSSLHPERPVHFLTGTAAPCTSLFKPVWFDTPLPDTGPQPGGVYDPAALFWRHEALHRETLLDYPVRIRRYRSERDAIEQEFVAGALECAAGPAAERAAFTTRCFAAADQAENRWLEQVSAAPLTSRPSWLYASAWNGFNQQAKIPGP